MYENIFPIIRQQTISTPPDGLLQVNWNHPVASGLQLLVPAFGNHISQPVNLVTGQKGVFDFTPAGPTIPLVSRWGVGHGGEASKQGRSRFELASGTQTLSVGAIASRVVGYTSDIDLTIRIHDSGDQGENLQFQIINGYVSGSAVILSQHDFVDGSSLTGPDPAPNIGDIMSVIGTVYHTGGDWYLRTGQTTVDQGFRTTSGGPNTNPVWSSNLQTVRINDDNTGNSVFFAYFVWDRILSLDEMEMVTSLQGMWDLFKPLPRHFVFYEAGQTITVNQVTETNLAQAVAWDPKNRLIAQITETDLTQTISILKAKAIGQAVETDLAQAVARLKTLLIAQVSETDLAQIISISGELIIAVNQIIETDLAHSILWSPKHRLVEQTVETDLAQALSSTKLKQIAQILESDLAQVVGIIRSITLGQALESDLAQALSSAKLKGIIQATEIDTAWSIGYGESVLIVFILFELSKRSSTFVWAKREILFDLDKREATMDITYL